nr:hypothetical protein SHINE37_41469 [Rhizobiaceae bacterium]
MPVEDRTSPSKRPLRVMARMSMLWKSPTFTFAMAWLPQRVTGPVHHPPEVPVAFPGARLPICRGRRVIPGVPIMDEGRRLPQGPGFHQGKGLRSPGRGGPATQKGRGIARCPGLARASAAPSAGSG